MIILFYAIVVLVPVFLVLLLVEYLDYREDIRREQERLTLASRTMESKLRLDTGAFVTASRIQDALRRHRGSR